MDCGVAAAHAARPRTDFDWRSIGLFAQPERRLTYIYQHVRMHARGRARVLYKKPAHPYPMAMANGDGTTGWADGHLGKRQFCQMIRLVGISGSVATDHDPLRPGLSLQLCVPI